MRIVRGVVALTLAGLLGACGARADGAVSLPNRLGDPSPLSGSIDSSPIGAASVMFGSPASRWDGRYGMLVLVGSSKDEYRFYDNEVGPAAGLDAVLSPDGRAVAATNEIVDLSTGATRALPALDAEYVAPQAWSPDGRLVAAVAYRFNYVSDEKGNEVPGPGAFAALYVIEAATGQATRIADLDIWQLYDGWTVAFAPDSARLAYQRHDVVTVATVDGRALSHFTAPDHRQLAGRGAWTPDGRGLALVGATVCCDGHEWSMYWRIEVVDAVTGKANGGYRSAEVGGVTVLRLLGWAPSGDAVAVATYPDTERGKLVGFDREYSYGSVKDGVRSSEDVVSLEYVVRAAVLELAPDAPPQVLIGGGENVALSIDIADNAIAAGRVRVAELPYWTMGRVLPFFLIGLALALIAFIAAIVRLRRAFLRRYPLVTPAEPDTRVPELVS
jgi:hypothetical protein